MKKAQREYSIINICMADELLKKLREEAEIEERTLSQTLRRIVRLYFDAKEAGEMPCPKNPTP
jgi:hypothetical protein